MTIAVTSWLGPEGLELFTGQVTSVSNFPDTPGNSSHSVTDNDPTISLAIWHLCIPQEQRDTHPREPDTPPRESDTPPCGNHNDIIGQSTHTV